MGQIWIAHPDRGPGIYVLIIEVHDDHMRALLCSDECDLATETDAVLEPESDSRWEESFLSGAFRFVTSAGSRASGGARDTLTRAA